MSLGLPENYFPVLMQAATTTSSAITTSYFNIKGAMPVYVIFQLKQAATHATECKIYQATNVAGDGGVVLATSLKWWKVADIATSDVPVRATDAATLLATAGVTDQLIICQIDPGALSATTTAIAAYTAASSEATNFCTFLMINNTMYRSDSPPTALTD